MTHARSRLTTPALATALLFAGVPSLVAQEADYPTEPPPPLEPTEVRFPDLARDTLSNGLELVVVENHEQPVVSVRLYLHGGEVADPAGKTGVANLVSSVLDKGTPDRTAEEIASGIEGVGASLTTGAADDYAFVGATALSRHLPHVLEIVSDVVRNATFPEEEFETEKKRMLSGLRVQLSQPGVLASRNFGRLVYGEHPYALEPTPETVEEITRSDLESFHAEQYTPAGGLLIFAGDIDAESALRSAERWFGDWEGEPPARVEMPEPPSREDTRLYLVHRPASVQSNIRVGHLGIRPGNEDVHALEVMNRVLGGGANARLFLILREEKGWTYGAYSGLTSPRDVGYFAARAEVRSPVTDSALSEMMRQLRRIRNEEVPAEELADAKRYLTGHFPLEIETPSQVASKVADVLVRGLGVDHLESYRGEISAVTAEDVRRVAGEYVHPDRAVIVVVGDATEVRDGLTELAPVTILNTDGEEISPSDLGLRRSDVALDAGLIRTGTLDYSVTAQGLPLEGDLEVRLERAGEDRFTVSRTLTAGMLNQSSSVTFTANLTPVSSRSRITAGPMSLSSDLTYEGGRVTGSATVPEQGGEGGGPPQLEEVRVDTTLAEGAIDSNMILPALLASPLEAGVELDFPAYEAQQRGTVQYSAEVVGTETIEVMAGSFDVYRVELSSPDASQTLYLSREAPRMLIKQELTRPAPISIELRGVGTEEETEGGGGS